MNSRGPQKLLVLGRGLVDSNEMYQGRLVEVPNLSTQNYNQIRWDNFDLKGDILVSPYTTDFLNRDGRGQALFPIWGNNPNWVWRAYSNDIYTYTNIYNSSINRAPQAKSQTQIDTSDKEKAPLPTFLTQKDQIFKNTKSQGGKLQWLKPFFIKFYIDLL